MALKIRLRPQGRTNRQTYRLVVADIRSPIDGKYIEMLGWYNPFQEEGNVSVNTERMSYWLNIGAEISPKAEALFAKAAPEAMKEWMTKKQVKRTKLVAKRREAKTSK